MFSGLFRAQGSVVPDEGQCVQRELAARGFGRQKKQLVELLPGHCFEQRENRAYGLADARGGLRHEALARLRRFVHRPGQRALARAGGVRKVKGIQGRITRRTVRQLLA